VLRVSRGGSPSCVSAAVVGVSTGALHAFVDQVHARLADPGAGVVVGAADVGEVERIARRVDALRLALVARADRQQVHRRTGHSSTSAWVASATRGDGARAARDVVLATSLAGEGLAATRAAFDAGDVSGRSAGIIASTMDKLPESLTDVERAKVETSLVQKAKVLNPGRLSRAAKFALADAERSAQEVADHVEAQLLDQETRAYRLATVTMQDLGDGTTKLHALLPTFTARMLGKVLQSMTAPRRDHLRQAAEAMLADGQTAAGDLADGSVAADLHASTRHPAHSTTAGNTAGAAFGIGAGRGVGRNADWADIDWAHRRGRALTELIEHLDTERLTGKVAATVIVTMTMEQAVGAAQAALVQQSVRESTGTLLEMTPSAGAASTDTGTLISASAARRIACQAGILPAVLGGPGTDPRPRPTPPVLQRPTTHRPRRRLRHLRRRRVRPTLRVVRTASPTPVVQRRPDRPGPSHPVMWLPPSVDSRPPPPTPHHHRQPRQPGREDGSFPRSGDQRPQHRPQVQAGLCSGLRVGGLRRCARCVNQ